MGRPSHKKVHNKRIVTENNNQEWRDDANSTDHLPPKHGRLNYVKVFMTVGLFLLPPAVSLLWEINMYLPLDYSSAGVPSSDTKRPHTPEHPTKHTEIPSTDNKKTHDEDSPQSEPGDAQTFQGNILGNEMNTLDKIRNFRPTFLKSMNPKSINVGGKLQRPVELHPTKPVETSVRVFLYENFLTPFECRGLIRVHQRHVDEVSQQVPLFCFDGTDTLRRHLRDNNIDIALSAADFLPGTLCLNESLSSLLESELRGSWSYSTAFYPGESTFSQVFAERVQQATGLLRSNGGKLQITSYPPGVGYKTHTDCLLGTRDKRDRFATVLVYLQDVAEGGETEFPELGLSVRPREGQALVWTNMDEEGACDPSSSHQAARVRVGHKYILQRWYYYQNFFTLGQRPVAPHLPQRSPDQPRITCDEYEHGSCRWYDEWDYHHLVDYNRIKGRLA